MLYLIMHNSEVLLTWKYALLNNMNHLDALIYPSNRAIGLLRVNCINFK